MELTQEIVKYRFNYKDGFLYFKIKTGRGVKVGKLCGYVRTNTKRRVIIVNYEAVFASRLIFLWHHGFLPEIVDHIDRDVKNDRIENLRAADWRQNNCNVTKKKNATSVYMGVSWAKQNNKWLAGIRAKHRRFNLGYFEKEEDAAIAYNRAAVKYHGEFANLNIIKPSKAA